MPHPVIHTPFGNVPVPVHSKVLDTLAEGRYDAMGFDLDHTLLRYNIPELMRCVFNSQVQYLITHEGFPKEPLMAIDFSRVERYCGKGVVLDIDDALIFKLDSVGKISMAIDAMGEVLDVDTVGEHPHASEAVPGYDPETFVFTKGSRYAQLPSYFDIPLAALWVACHLAGVQDHPPALASDLEKNKGDHLNPIMNDDNEVIDDVARRRRALFAAFIRGFIHNYCGTDGRLPRGRSWFFDEMLSNPQRYLVKWTPEEIAWVSTLRKRFGCTPFIVSNALAEFVEFAMDYITDRADWRSWFSFVIAEARKPLFFDTKKVCAAPMFVPFCNNMIDNNSSKTNHSPLSTIEAWDGITYRQGNAAEIERAITRDVARAPRGSHKRVKLSSSNSNSGNDNSNNEVLEKGKSARVNIIYVGDHLRNDVWACKDLLKWDTIAIVEELSMEHIMDSIVDGIQTTTWDYLKAWGSVFTSDTTRGKHSIASKDGPKPTALEVTASAGLMVMWADLVVPSVRDLVHDFERTVNEPEDEDD